MKNVTISGVKSSWTIPVNAERRKLLNPVNIQRVLDVAGLHEVDADVGDLVVDGLETLAQLLKPIV